MAMVNDTDNDDALSQEKIAIVSFEPAMDWDVLGDLSSIEIIFSNMASTFDAHPITPANDQPATNIPNSVGDQAVDDESGDDDSLFSEEEIKLRFESHDSFGFGCQC